MENTKRRKLKVLDRTFTLYAIHKFGFPLCCIDWFYNVDCVLRSSIPEYSETMHILANNEGRILCPEHIILKLEEKKH
jgi:hypothetical protein